MFFNKPSTPPAATLCPLAIIGTSPLAFYLADILQNNHYNVTILVAANQLESWSRLGSFTIKPTNFHTHHTNFRFASHLDSSVEYCFIASSPEANQSDLLLLQDSSLATVPIINLSSFYNRDLIAKFTKTKVITAYFSGALSLDKNTLQSLERNPKIELCCDSETASPIKQLFESSVLSFSFSTASITLYWRHFAPFYISNLLLLLYQQDISATLMQPAIRHLADSAINEICRLAAAEKATLEAGDVLTEIYAQANGSQNEFSSTRNFTVFANLLKGVDRFETPALHELLRTTAKKY